MACGNNQPINNSVLSKNSIYDLLKRIESLELRVKALENQIESLVEITGEYSKFEIDFKNKSINQIDKYEGHEYVVYNIDDEIMNKLKIMFEYVRDNIGKEVNEGTVEYLFTSMLEEYMFLCMSKDSVVSDVKRSEYLDEYLVELSYKFGEIDIFN